MDKRSSSVREAEEIGEWSWGLGFGGAWGERVAGVEVLGKTEFGGKRE
jgi:hypothetical protein